MLLSVIIPIYNAVRYLETCVDSVLAFPGVGEVILIDDGSTDGSGELCDRLAAAHPTVIRVSHQPNRGVSAARNRGLCLAHGEWLWFVDADDRVLLPASVDGAASSDGTAWANILSQTDAVLVNAGFVWEEQGQAQTFGARSDEVPYNLWRCWFRRDKVCQAGLFFSVNRRYAEDQEFILRYLLRVGSEPRIAFPSPIYHYTMRPGSAMTRTGTRLRQMCDLVKVIWCVIKEKRQSNAAPTGWVNRELRRLVRSLWTTATRK